MVMLWILIIFPCISNVYFAEIITVENKTHVLCATNDQYSVIYIKPLRTEKTENLQILIQDDIWNDWLLRNSTDTLEGPVLDKRWEDFEIIYTNYNRFTSVSSLSFSIYSPDQIEFYINDDESLDYFFIPPNTEPWVHNNEPWVHYTVLLKNGNVYIIEHLFKSHRLLRTINNFAPSQIVVKTNNMTFWKLHNYNLRWAKRISQSPTSVPVSSKESSCLMLSASLCLHCSLKASVSGNTYSFDGGNNTSLHMMESWKTERIAVEAGNNITFMRYTRNGNSVGDWKVDIRKCPRMIKSECDNGKWGPDCTMCKKIDGTCSNNNYTLGKSSLNSNYVIYEVKGEDAKNEMNRMCYPMSYKDQDKDNRNKRSINESESSICGVGKLGTNCDVTCKDLLGSEIMYCQKHRICENSECFCAWGFKSPSCEQECDNGKWGLNCVNNCTNCEVCNKRDGTCSNNNYYYYPLEKSSLNWNSHHAWFPVLFILPTVLLGVGALTLLTIFIIFRIPTIRTLRKTSGQSLKVKDNFDPEASRTYEMTAEPCLETS